MLLSPPSGNPRIWLPINSRVAGIFKLIETDYLDWSWLKLTETDWQWQKVDRNGSNESQRESRGKPCEIAKKWLRRFRMKGGSKTRYRPRGVFGKGVGNSKNRQKCVRNASKMRHKCVTMGLVLLGKEERSKMRQKCVRIASKVRQKCAEHLWGRRPFGQYRKTPNMFLLT